MDAQQKLWTSFFLDVQKNWASKKRGLDVQHFGRQKKIDFQTQIGRPKKYFQKINMHKQRRHAQKSLCAFQATLYAILMHAQNVMQKHVFSKNVIHCLSSQVPSPRVDGKKRLFYHYGRINHHVPSRMPNKRSSRINEKSSRINEKQTKNRRKRRPNKRKSLSDRPNKRKSLAE